MRDSIVIVIGVSFRINKYTTYRDLVYQHQGQAGHGESFATFLTWPDGDSYFWPEGEGCLGLVLILEAMKMNRKLTHELLSRTDPEVILKYCIDHKTIRLLQFLTYHLSPHFLKKKFSTIPAWAISIILEQHHRALAEAISSTTPPAFQLQI